MKKSNSNQQVAKQDYNKLLAEIKSHIEQTQNQIVKKITREKVVMAWNIGKTINEYLPKDRQLEYGKNLLEQLAKDIFINETVLYKMHSFYKAYPKIPQDDDGLNWSHYRVLSGIKKAEERKYLEDLTRQNKWGAETLQKEASNLKNVNEKDSDASFVANGFVANEGGKKDSGQNISITKNKTAKPKKLIPIRGKLFSYPLIKLDDSDQNYLDCGFNIFREVEEKLPKNLENTSAKSATIVNVTKKEKSYLLKESQTHPKNINVYKAYLEKVVDGDTIRVVLDLGFRIFHKEILRLKGIDAPELSTIEGKKSSDALKQILKDVPFLIIKTIKVDIYGRYVADVFLAPPTRHFREGGNPANLSNSHPELVVGPQQIADSGVYLNQMLLDKGLAGSYCVEN